MDSKFSLVKEGKYRVFVLREVELEIVNMKDKEALKKILANLDRIAERIPNKPEQWENIKSCKDTYELKIPAKKSGSYRLGCYFNGRYLLIVHFWKVEKNISKGKRQDIEVTCKKVEEYRDEFERFVRTTQI